jgi:DNA-directed RNA polymerase subunit M/transcription elongation factor TFIIS
MAKCSICSGELIYLGRLGNNDVTRCRNCGMEFNNVRKTMQDRIEENEIDQDRHEQDSFDREAGYLS